MGISILRRLAIAASLLFTSGLTGCSSAAPPKSDVAASPDAKVVSPADPKIRYTGRVAVSESAVHYDWANVQIEFRLRAPQVEILLDDGKNDYNLFIDGTFARIISTTDETKNYQVDLDGGEHLVKITKRTGPNFGAGAFLGLTLPQGGELLELPPRLPRKIEFIGDSNTIGYGNEGPGLDCGGVYRPYENSYLSAASIAARELNAEGHLIAISGYGAVRNYGDSNITSPTPVPYFYDRTLKTREDLPWDFKRWTPDAVVVKLGTNDHSTQPEPPAEVFLKGIHGLLEQVHTAYKDVPVFLLADTSLPQLVERTKVATQQQREMGNTKTYFVKLTQPPKEQMGCDWHPLVVGHTNMAAELVAAMKPILGW